MSAPVSTIAVKGSVPRPSAAVMNLTSRTGAGGKCFLLYRCFIGDAFPLYTWTADNQISLRFLSNPLEQNWCFAIAGINPKMKRPQVGIMVYNLTLMHGYVFAGVLLD